MLVHSVFFWLKPEVDAQQQQVFATALQGLLKIEGVRHGFVGQPAATDAPVVDRSYHSGLCVVFDDLAAHDKYQVDPVHQAFIAQFGPSFAKVQVYDAV